MISNIMMSSCLQKMLYVLVLLLIHFAGPNLAKINCIEKERQALLNFKQAIGDVYGVLSTWKDDEKNGNCCNWNGVECYNETGHVHKLDLRSDDVHVSNLLGTINFTSLIDLQHMQYLDLSGNSFPDSLPELIGSFAELTYFNLSYCDIGGRIPHQLGNLSQLEYIDLRYNILVGAIPSELGKLTHLQHLDLSQNFLDGNVPSQLRNLSQLEYLNLVSNSLSGAIPFQNGDLPVLFNLGLADLDLKNCHVKWLSGLHSLTRLSLISFSNLGSSHLWLQMIGKLIPNLMALSLISCNLSDNDISSLFHSLSNNLSTTSLTILDLSYNMLSSSTFQLLFNFSLNLQELYLSNNNIVLSYAPLYLNFPSLLILDLSSNNLTSSIFQGIFSFSPKLENMKLQNCGLMDGSFLVSSSSIMNSSSSLGALDLSNNMLKSSAIFHWLFNITSNLYSLDIHDNLLEGPIPNKFGKVMSSLEHVDLSFNKLEGNIPYFFGNICTLQELYLSNNNLSGELSSFVDNSSWCNRHKFQKLILDYNQITGTIPTSIGLLSELVYLSLMGNSLEGDVTELHLNSFSKLNALFLSYNSLSINFASNWIPPFKLAWLKLASCRLGLRFPSWLQNQSYIFSLDISNAGLNDYVPEWFWNNLQHMGILNMSHNNLIGAIPNLPFKLPYNPSVIMNSNQFEGEVPSVLLQASELMLSGNKFSYLSSALCEKGTTRNLATLDLSNNQIKGKLPDCWESINSLLFLDLSNNKLEGKIPLSIGSLVKLEALVLRSNRLFGELPSTLKSCNNLILLDVGENLFSGPIPSWIGESMQHLIILSMGGNRFYGNLPIHLCLLRHIQVLDLSRNNLSNEIPTCISNLTKMSEKSINSSETQSHIYWYRTYAEIFGLLNWGVYTLNIELMWKGVEYSIKDPELRFKSIDLSSNNLIGNIPNEVGYLLGLVSLNLSRNNLCGEIPSEIGNLTSLDFLDLSKNHLSGRIPSSLTEIDGLGKLDLSNNNLSGRIPLGRHFQTFDASSFEGNFALCGEQVQKICPQDQAPIKPQGPSSDDEENNSAFYEALYMSLGIGFFAGFWGFLGPILLFRSWRIAYLRFLNSLTDYIYVTMKVNMAICHRWLNI